MEIKVNESDLRAVIQQLSGENAMLKANNSALGRTIQEMEMANVTTKEGDVPEDGLIEHPGTEEVGEATSSSGRNSSRAKATK